MKFHLLGNARERACKSLNEPLTELDELLMRLKDNGKKQTSSSVTFNRVDSSD